MKKDIKEFGDLLGKTIAKIEGCAEGSETITFHMSDGAEFVLAHEPDCCESVSVAQVDGDADDVCGSPLLLAEEAVNPEGSEALKEEDSYTWVFYRLGTVKGYLTIRRLGTSNGYYSERAQFRQTKDSGE